MTASAASASASSPLLLRYGHRIRLCTASAYTPSSSSSSRSSGSPLGIGYYEKNGRHGILNCVPPLGKELDALFNEDEYAVLDPSGRHNPGDVVEYGHALVLVNQHGMVWNNKTGGITGYVGPRPRSLPGEIFVAFYKSSGSSSSADKSSSESSASRRSSAKRSSSSLSLRPTTSISTSTSTTASMSDRESTDTVASAASDSESSPRPKTGNGISPVKPKLDLVGTPVSYGDDHVVISVVESNRRHSTMFHKCLTNFKKPSSRIDGGYICCDGKGTTLEFAIYPANPKVDRISMFRKCITRYAFGNKIAMPAISKEMTRQDTPPDIHFKLSNDTTATLTTQMLHAQLLRHARIQHQDDAPETVFSVPVRDGPGELVVKFTGVVPRKAIAKLQAAEASVCGGDKSKTKAEAENPAQTRRRHVRPTLLQRLGAIVRMLPLPVFVLLYAGLIHVTLTAHVVTSSKVPRELIVSTLVLLPVLYLAIKLDHPLSTIFHASGAALEAEDEPGQGLKLIVSEYRFRPGVIPIAPVTNAAAKPPRSAMSLAQSTATTSRLSSSRTSESGVDPLADVDVPSRFVNAEKGDIEKARARYLVTMDWRKTECMDTILSRPWPEYRMVKRHYPHFYYKRGKQNEPVYYEKPGVLDFKAARADNLTVDVLLHNNLVSTEFLWQVLERDDNKKCISVLDIEGFGLSDCFGEPLEFVRKCSAISGMHYPERCAYIIVLNVPSWFSVVWKAVQPLIDEVTRQKITLVRGGSKTKILEALEDKIPIENIPQEYGGLSVGQSPEDILLEELMAFVNHEEGAPATNPILQYVGPNHPAIVGDQDQP